MIQEPEELNEGDLHLYVQRWHPESYECEDRVEVAVPEKASLVELEAAFAERFGIRQEDIEVLHCNMYHGLDALEVPGEKWESLAQKKPATSYGTASSCTVGGSPWFCKDGELFLIKDKTVPEKALSAEDKKALASSKIYSGRKSYGSRWGGGRDKKGVVINTSSQVKRRPSVEVTEATEAAEKGEPPALRVGE